MVFGRDFFFFCLSSGFFDGVGFFYGLLVIVVMGRSFLWEY